MHALRNSPSFNSSAASSYFDSSDDIETSRVKNFVKDLLKSRIFLGRYIERRLVDQKIGYRDIVVISPAETDFKKDLLAAHFKLRTLYPSIHWIGISEPEAAGLSYSSICLWTEIESEPFGPFWFQVKTIKYRDNEIIITLKCLRHISESFLEIEPILTGSSKKSEPVSKAQTTSEITSLSAPLNESWNEILVTLKNALTITNVKEFITFLCAFVIAVFTGSTAFINFLGNFVLALIREMSILIKNSTPMFLGLLEFFSKIVGGFYILLSMFLRPSPPPPSSSNKRAIKYEPYGRSSSDYDYKQFD